MSEIFIFGQRYEVPEELTILRALEWVGFRLTRGVGCRGGFCGACGTVFRLPGHYRLHYALACQTVVQPGMMLGQIPFFPAQRAAYELDTLEPSGATLLAHYPELLRCYGCNTCSKACPQEIDVLGYIAAAIHGDLPAAAEDSFDCIMCGLCTARCPAEIAPPHIGLLSRRLYGKYLTPRAEHLYQRVQDIANGAFQQEVDELKSLSADQLHQRYETRQIEA